MESNYREYSTIDKSSWGPGPWQDEKDKAQWIDPETGLDCLIVRSPGGGNLCGYVGVPDTHPLYGKDYNDIDVNAHGGLTFSAKCAETSDESRFICHVPAPGRPDHVWWFGFDCAHSWDVSPAYASRYGGVFSSGDDQSYKTWNYVRNEIHGLAQQLAAFSMEKVNG